MAAAFCNKAGTVGTLICYKTNLLMSSFQSRANYTLPEDPIIVHSFGQMLQQSVGVVKELPHTVCQRILRWHEADSSLFCLPCRDRQRVGSSVVMHCCCFCLCLQEVVRQKVRRQLSKQQKAAQRRRLQRGEANLVTKSRRENENTIKSSIEGASFWGWMGLQWWTDTSIWPLFG